MRQEILLTKATRLYRKSKEWDGIFDSGRTLKAGTVVAVGDVRTLHLKQAPKECHPLFFPEGACGSLGICGEDYYVLEADLPAGKAA